MKPKLTIATKEYAKKNPKRAALIKRAVKRGIKEYAETFRRLVST